MVKDLLLIRKPFYFIRHGATDWNQQRKVMGQQDIPLNEEGRQQAISAVEILKNLAIDQIIHSPLIRAVETAQIINSFLQIRIISIPGLRESGKGIIEGKTKQEVDGIKEWLAGRTPRGAEHVAFFNKRIIKTLNHILSSDKVPLIVSHSGVFKAIASLLGFSGIHTHNCAIYSFMPSKINQSWEIKLVER
ncbi:MAG: histidine phosphatase family protein [Rickettsiaceae bacterium]|nr:histidine phosphatase family protein [Rickettsiaceae bacterium]